MSYARRRLLPLAAAALLGAAGCGGTAQHAASPAADVAAAWHRVVLCGRTHGMPNLPDPTIDAQGKAHFPASVRDIPPETRRACQAMYDRLVPPNSDRALTQADLDRLLQFARCMRSHGIPDWPDPNSNGDFPLPARLRQTLKSAIRPQLIACNRFNPKSRGRIYATHS